MEGLKRVWRVCTTFGRVNDSQISEAEKCNKAPDSLDITRSTTTQEAQEKESNAEDTDGVPHPQQFYMIENAGGNPSAAIYHVPDIFSMDDLYCPTMVSITVSGVHSEPSQQTFSVPRALISSKSAYFGKAFNNGFKETIRREINLTDVSPQTFKVFIGWLFTGRVFLSDPNENAGSGGLGKRKRTDEAEDGRRVKERLQKPTTPNADLHTSAPSEPAGTIAVPDVSSSSKSDASNTFDYQNPVSWPWSWLIKLYIFADEYDTRGLRMLTHELIDLKLLSRRPRKYPLPNQNDIAMIYQHLPSGSGLRRLMVDRFAKTSTLTSFGDDRATQTRTLADFPPEFVLDCLVIAKSHICAYKCLRKNGGNCEDPRSHLPWDRYPVAGSCFFHEHGDNEDEMDMCIDKWDALDSAYGVFNRTPKLD